LGASPQRGFIVGGTSAGGNAAAVLSILAREEKLSPPLTGVALLIPALTDHEDPPPQFASRLISLQQNAQAPILGQQHIERFEGAYKADGKSPLFNSLACRVSGLPRTFVQVCGLDPLRDEALVYVEELDKAGIETKLKIYNGVSHGFWSVFPKWEKSKMFVRDTVEGVKWLIDEGNKGAS
jgi:acetyl esterase/lipase